MVILSAGVGALAGVLTTSWKSRKDLELEYDIDLRKRRIDAYAQLWKLLEPLADYFEPGPVTHGAARNLGAALRGWYFRVGGLVLSSSTRPVYFNLQQALEGATGGAAEDFLTLDERPLENIAGIGEPVAYQLHSRRRYASRSPARALARRAAERPLASPLRARAGDGRPALAMGSRRARSRPVRGRRERQRPRAGDNGRGRSSGRPCRERARGSRIPASARRGSRAERRGLGPRRGCDRSRG
jgi:hypothetical protein